MNMWDVSEQDLDKAGEQADEAVRAVYQVKRAGGGFFSESEVVEAVRIASGDELAQTVHDNIATLRVIFKAWLAQR